MESVAVIYLENAEGASCEVQQNVSNAPALCALSEEVHVSLGDVLDGSDGQFDVGCPCQKVTPSEGGPGSCAGQYGHKVEAHHSQDEPTCLGHYLATPSIDQGWSLMHFFSLLYIKHD